VVIHPTRGTSLICYLDASEVDNVDGSSCMHSYIL